MDQIFRLPLKIGITNRQNIKIKSRNLQKSNRSPQHAKIRWTVCKLTDQRFARVNRSDDEEEGKNTIADFVLSLNSQ